MPYIALDPISAEPAPVIPHGAPLQNQQETLASLRAELFYLLGGREDATDDRLDKWINEAYVDLWTSLDLPEAKTSFSLTLVPGQAMYLLPPQVTNTLGVAVVDSTLLQGGRPLDKIDLTTYRRYEVESGRPSAYFRSGKNMIVFYPTPNAAHTVVVDFLLVPLPLVDDTDSPILGWEWYESIKLNARQKGFSALLEFDRAILAGNDYVNQVRRKPDTEAEEDSGKIIRSSVPRNGRMITHKQHDEEVW